MRRSALAEPVASPPLTLLVLWRCVRAPDLFEWVIVNPVVAPLRDGVAVFTWQRSGGVDAVRRTIVFAIVWWLVQGCIGLNYWLAQAGDPTQGPVAESAYVHSDASANPGIVGLRTHQHVGPLPLVVGSGIGLCMEALSWCCT